MMTVLTVLEVPNILLSQTADDVVDFDDSLNDFVTDLFDTMHAYKGIGLAAPQVGVLKRLFVCEYDNNCLVCINPTLEVYGDELESEEGCLSIPNILATVTRYSGVKVSAYDINGDLFTQSFDGMMAVVIQHENDHLNGVLITHDSLKTRYHSG
tara:strand:- start:873 stop:1334 length:462 start_codon:yes stop_codon:yes gene_type:complete